MTIGCFGNSAEDRYFAGQLDRHLAGQESAEQREAALDEDAKAQAAYILKDAQRFSSFDYGYEFSYSNQELTRQLLRAAEEQRYDDATAIAVKMHAAFVREVRKSLEG